MKKRDYAEELDDHISEYVKASRDACRCPDVYEDAGENHVGII